jgi:hypothetical protein
VQNLSQLLILEKLNAESLLKVTVIGEAIAISYTQSMLVGSKEKLWLDGCMMSILTTKLQKKNARKQRRQVVSLDQEVDQEIKNVHRVEKKNLKMMIAIIEIEIEMKEEITDEVMMTGHVQEILSLTTEGRTTIIIAQAIVVVETATKTEEMKEDTKRMYKHMTNHLLVIMTKVSYIKLNLMMTDAFTMTEEVTIAVIGKGTEIHMLVQN